MARIVIDARESGTSTGRYIDKLVEYLHGLKPAHEFIVLTHAHRLDFLRGIAPDFQVVESPYKEFTFSEQIGFKRQIEALKPDLVHFGMVQQPVWYRGKVVATMHDLTTVRFRNPAKNPVVFTLKQQVYKWVNKRVARKSAAIITISEWSKQDIVAFTGVNPDKVRVTYPAADAIPDEPVPVSGLEGERFILYVGRPLPHKNLDRLIDAFALIKQRSPGVKLVLAGKKDALYDRIEVAVRHKGLGDDVIFTGFVTEGELRWLYEHCAVYAFPSLSEGFGLPGLEAMQHGAPVASSNATCLPEIYAQAAAYFDPFAISEMSDVIYKILSDSDYANKLRTLGRERVVCFSWKTMAEYTFSVYESVLASK